MTQLNNAQGHTGARADADQTHARCPYCGAEETEPLSLFGKQLMTTQLYCLRCHTPFEYVKDNAILQVFQARKGDQL